VVEFGVDFGEVLLFFPVGLFLCKVAQNHHDEKANDGCICGSQATRGGFLGKGRGFGSHFGEDGDFQKLTL
jgi:hypothetical protein